ncbi:hypothetical protein HPB50_026100 [Hyalomma asiaticum]|uniref:Uncharacterized protein n=1 Tax=Hyalomma asiaticum TaxID=266040 RepID=A0ACB7TTI1_HYAAI|nr:hypothetical protein HPB50_026100 [Hyalomma asiaticum]
MGYIDINFSSGWFDRFKKKNSAVSKSVHGESGTVDEATADNWRSSWLAELQKSYADRDILNLDEAALFYKMLPSRTFTLKGGASSGGRGKTTERQRNGPFQRKCYR